jgi:guanine deaminase
MSDAIQVSKLRRTLLGETVKPIGLEEVFYLGTAGGGAFFSYAARLSERAGSAADSPAGAENGSAADSAENSGADFPGASGSFEPGYDFDALVIDDGELACPSPLSIRDRLERVVYLSDDRHIQAKFVRGLEINTTAQAEQSQMYQNQKAPYR